ncbi:MAG: hypothetical protein QM804_07085 [Propionicimonas sp.]
MVRRWFPALAAALLLAGCGSPDPSVPTPAAATPSVVLSPTDTAAGTVYAPADLDGDARRAWLERLRRTVGILADTDLGPADDDWDGRLAVELPQTSADYAALAGPAGAEAAAVTRCLGDGSRITINPAVRDTGADYLDALVLHEAVHAATGSACRPAPLWIEEGLAEWLTVQHHPAAAQTNQQWLTRELAGGLPSGLPEDAAFQGTAEQVSGGYALAVFAVDTAIGRLGQARAMAYFAAPDEPTTRQLTGWYLDGLRARLGPPAATASAPR